MQRQPTGAAVSGRETSPTLLHVQADGPDSWAPAGAPGLRSRRLMERVADYLYAAPGGAARLLVAEFSTLEEAARAAAAAPDQTAEVNVFRQLSPAHGWLTAAGVEDGPTRPTGDAVLSVVMDVEPAALDDFHGWYEEEHLPKLAQVPGILCAQRFAAVPSAGASEPDGGRTRFLAWYEMATTDVVASAEFADASVLTPRTAAVTAHLSWASQLYRKAT